MADLLFYHVEHRPWEDELPSLLKRELQQGSRIVIQVGQEGRVQAVSESLWAALPEPSFIPHGTAADGEAERQPIWITAGEDAPNGGDVRFFLEGAEPQNLDGLTRAVILFDGRDPQAVDQARGLWRKFKTAGHEIVYHKLDDSHEP